MLHPVPVFAFSIGLLASCLISGTGNGITFLKLGYLDVT
jgi:hypothetical protein